MDVLNNLRVFIRVVDCASFTGAADALDLSTAQVLAFRNGTLDEVARLPQEDVAAYPSAGSSNLDHALWAAKIKARALMHLYPRSADEDLRHSMGRSMHADLESAVDRVFDQSEGAG